MTLVKTRSVEGRQLLEDVVDRLSTQGADLSFALRTALHACNLLGWTDAADWISKEIKGHDGKSSVPPHRTVTAYVQWRAYAMNDVIEQVVAGQRKVEERDPVPWILLGGIDQLVLYAQKGVIMREEEDEDRWFDISKKMTKGRKVTVVEASEAGYCLNRLHNELFEWASRSLVALKTGDIASDIWAANRAGVDEFLARIGFGGHLSTIQEGLVSPEPQRWRESMWSSRDLLHDVAEYLWKDPRKTYPHLLDDEGSPIKVTADKFVNRLMAYMHQKGVVGTLGAELRAEWARLRGLNALASSAHDKGAVTLEDAKFTFFSIYMLLGELVTRTDREPIDKYE